MATILEKVQKFTYVENFAMALYQVFKSIKNSIISENLVLLTQNEQFRAKSARIRPTTATSQGATLTRCGTPVNVNRLKVVGLTLTSSLGKQIAQTHSCLLTNNCHRLVELMLSFPKIVRGDNFHSSGGKSHLNCGLKNKSSAFYGLTFQDIF